MDGPFEVLAARLTARPEHFFPPELLASQFTALEPLGPDEDGVEIDVALDPQTQVGAVLRGLGLP